MPDLRVDRKPWEPRPGAVGVDMGSREWRYQVKEASRTVVKAKRVQAMRLRLAQARAAKARKLLDDAAAERAVWRSDPVGWVSMMTGEWLAGYQREIFESIRDNRHSVVRSCHGSGKTMVASRAVAWWLDCHPPGEAFVVTTAPTFTQVRSVLWREVARCRDIVARRHEAGLAPRMLPGDVGSTEWHLPSADGKGKELVALGRKPKDRDPTAFQGIHARYVLAIADEACGVSKELWAALRTITTGPECRVLAIGNPDDGDTEFARACLPGSGWAVKRIQAWDTPMFTGELDEALKAGEVTVDQHTRLSDLMLSPQWVEEVRNPMVWGEQSPLWVSKVDAEFPFDREDTVFNPAWLSKAVNVELRPAASGPFSLGVDIARFGSCETVIVERRGPVFLVKHAVRGHDTMDTVGNLVRVLDESQAWWAVIDPGGVGGGVVDRAVELGLPAHGLNVAGVRSTQPEKFVDLRSELYWELRSMAERDELSLPHDDVLIGQLASTRYRLTSSGRIEVESKAKMADRGLPSPDRADALLLSLLDPRALES